MRHFHHTLGASDGLVFWWHMARFHHFCYQQHRGIWVALGYDLFKLFERFLWCFIGRPDRVFSFARFNEARFYESIDTDTPLLGRSFGFLYNRK